MDGWMDTLREREKKREGGRERERAREKEREREREREREPPLFLSPSLRVRERDKTHVECAGECM